MIPWLSRGKFLRAAAALALVPAPRGQSVLTQEEALALAFPDAEGIERHTAYLSGAELARARAAAGEGVAVETRVVTYYLALRSERPMGVAYFDVHRVRTLPEVLMVVVGTCLTTEGGRSHQQPRHAHIVDPAHHSQVL